MALLPPSADDEADAPVPAGLAVPADPDQEVEIWWGGYAGRTMIPAFTLCGLVSAAVLLGARLLWQEEGVPIPIVGRIAFYLIVLVWAIALGRWAYLTVTVGYRLTTRHLLIERGFSHPARPALPLQTVRHVRVEQRAWERWVGVGRVVVEADDTRAILFGLRDPESVAVEVQRRVEVCREAAGRKDL